MNSVQTNKHNYNNERRVVTHFAFATVAIFWGLYSADIENTTSLNTFHRLVCYYEIQNLQNESFSFKSGKIQKVYTRPSESSA